ncbi:LAMI_0C10088g1_1 [Lachancea mirantina]|uniref:LAMI_0C10088g1_1 n=1 Tax=Lachancea mirantina TaxID=1230905 RepID=A0A1G4J5W4_9SACH|nr:LAMI_0C10088g1_1 [Lachancea mirantina]
MSSNLASLLRNSKIAQVPKSRHQLASGGVKIAPTHQIIENKPSTLHRQEWGLKAALPSKVTSRYIVYDDLDTLERLTTFEATGGSQWNRLRFQELGVAPKYNPGKANPLFEGQSSSKSQFVPLSSLLDIDSSSSKAEIRAKLSQIKDLRGPFRKWLLERDPEALKNKNFNARDMGENAVVFLTETVSHAAEPDSRSLRKIVGAGGLTYSLNGRLRQSPNGVISKTIIPGRFLNVEGNDRLAAIGGFVANAGSSSVNTSQADYNMGDFVRELKIPFSISHASVLESGKVVLRANVVSGISSRARMQMNNRSHHQRQPRRPAPRSMSAEDSSKHAEELLNILTNFDSGKKKN